MGGGAAGRMAFISDVHSNLEALRAVIDEVDGTPTLCLGDVVGYGASPNEVIALLRERGVRSVMGNHDRAVLGGGGSGGLGARAAMAALWTSRELTGPSREYLAGLPTEMRVTLNGHEIFMAHGSPDDRLEEYVDPSTHSDVFGFYLKRLSVEAVALGHTHIPYVWEGRHGVVFNPGSVGQPRSGDRRAAYAVLSDEGGRLRVEQHLVPYDVGLSAEKIVKAGLPEAFARRLSAGV